MKKGYTNESFIEKARLVHGNIYNYSKVEYVNSTTPVCIVCPEHGEFWQTPVAHLRGNGCKECGKKKQGKRFNKEYNIKRAIEIHNGKYSYEHFKPEDTVTTGLITCPIHGDFEMCMNSHINQKQGCPKCVGHNLTLEEIKEKLSEVDGGKYICLETEKKKMNDKWLFLCPEHGEFEQSATKHLRGQGCPYCYGYVKKDKNSFEVKARKIHGAKYDYSKAVYTNNKEDVCIVCPEHGEFFQSPFNHLHGHGCPKCVDTISSGEKEIKEYLESIGVNGLTFSNRDIIPPNEIDIFDSNRKIAIEYDGLRWHSEKFVDEPSYHLMKTERCSELGIRLIHIFEDEWVDKQDIVKSRLRTIFNKTENRIYARECKIREVTFKDSKAFLDKCHIQGNCVSKYRYGLYYNGELVSLMTFGKLRKNLGSKMKNNTYELLRFCNKLNTSVIGGASKLLKRFIEEIEPDEIISYCDRRWSDGNMYRKLGFTMHHISKPNYFYVIKGKRENRFAYRKNILVEKYGCSPEMSEREFMKDKGWYRIYDCGTMVWKLKI